MDPLRFIVAVIAVWVFVKFLLMMFNPKGFLKWANGVLTGRKKWILKYVYLILFFVMAYYLLQELTVVQFFAAMIAGMLLFAHTLAHYPNVLNMYVDQFKGDRPNSKVLFDWVLWLLLAAWVLKELFF